MSEYKAFDPLQTFSVVLQSGRSQEWLKAAAEQFWLNQDHLLDCAEKLHNGWLARRHEGTLAAREAAAAMLAAGSPAAAASEYQKWAAGAQSRLMADASAFQQLMSAATISMFEPISSPFSQAKPASRIASLGNAA
jgi:hypothetical protein